MRSTGSGSFRTSSIDVNVDKPPILFWGAAIASLPFGRVTPTTSRVPSAIGSLIVLLLTVRLGRRLWGSDAIAYGGAFVALTGIEFFQKCQWCSCDMSMAAFAFLAITLWGKRCSPSPRAKSRSLRCARLGGGGARNSRQGPRRAAVARVLDRRGGSRASASGRWCAFS